MEEHAQKTAAMWKNGLAEWGQDGDRIERYNQEQIEIVGERQEPRGDVSVLTRIVSGEYDGAEVNYRLRGKDGQWHLRWDLYDGPAIRLADSYRYRNRWGLLFGCPRTEAGPDADPAADDAPGRRCSSGRWPGSNPTATGSC